MCNGYFKQALIKQHNTSTSNRQTQLKWPNYFASISSKRHITLPKKPKDLHINASHYKSYKLPKFFFFFFRSHFQSDDNNNDDGIN